MNEPRRVVVIGGSGYLGRVLTAAFAREKVPVTVVSRHQTVKAIDGVDYRGWDGVSVDGDWADALNGAAVVVNLSGHSVNCRYNEANKKEIFSSRVQSTVAVGEAISHCTVPPPVWINASSATIYRDARDRPMDEAAGEIGSGFSVDVCRKWEQTLMEASTPARTRKVALRSSIVFGPTPGGVMDYFVPVARLGLGGPMGDGGQWVSWIHETDFTRAVRWIVDHETLSGPVNLAAPCPLPNREFMRTLRSAVRGVPFGLPAPAWLLEIAAVFLRTETELLLKSRRVVPGKLLQSGFTFCYPDWAEAVAAIARRDAT